MRSRKVRMKLPRKAGYTLPVLALAGLVGAGVTVQTMFAADPPADPPASSSSAQASIVPRVKPGEQSAAPLPKANIRVDTNVVLIPVTVTDPLNRFVTGLDQDVFEISEDKVKQKVISFGSEDAPLSVGIVFDTSSKITSRTASTDSASTK